MPLAWSRDARMHAPDGQYLARVPGLQLRRLGPINRSEADPDRQKKTLNWRLPLGRRRPAGRAADA